MKLVTTLNNNLNAQLPNDVKLITEGSGADTKYYIQRGADTASKKQLGSARLPLEGLNYIGGAGIMDFSVAAIRKMDKFIIRPETSSLKYTTKNGHIGISETVNWISVPANKDFDLKTVAKNTNNTHISVMTSATLYGTAHPFTIYL